MPAQNLAFYALPLAVFVQKKHCFLATNQLVRGSSPFKRATENPQKH